MTATSRKCTASWIKRHSEKGLLLAGCKMTALMVLITLMSSAGGKASDLFGELTGIAVLLTMLPLLLFLRRSDPLRRGQCAQPAEPDRFGVRLRLLLHRADGRQLIRTVRHLYHQPDYPDVHARK